MAQTILFADSFDHYSFANMGQKWDAIVDSGSGIATARTANGLHVQVNSSFDKIISGSLDATNTYTIGFAFRRNAYPLSGDKEVIVFRNSTDNVQQFGLSYSSTGVWKLWRGPGTTNGASILGGTVLASSSAAYAMSGFQYVELAVRVHNSAGTYELRIDGTPIAMSAANPATAQNTGTTGGTAGFNRFRIECGEPASTTFDYTIDDLYMLSDSAAGGSFLGDIRVMIARPAGDSGTYAAFTASPVQAHYLNVKDNSGTFPDGTTTRNESSTLNQQDNYTFDQLAGIQNIKAVQVVASVQAVTASRGVKLASRSGTGGAGTTDNLATEATVGTSSFTMIRNVWATNPATSAAWTLAEVNGAEFGLKLTT